MSLGRGDFPAFFAAVHGGRTPFAWQRRLLEHVLDTGAWPAEIDAPTGAGKTAAIDVHVFALAAAAAQGSAAPPRRLSMVVARRALVDDQHRHAAAVRDALSNPQNPVLAAVAEQLWQLRAAAPIPGASPLVIARLRGGQPPSRGWLDEPTAAAVLCATPDMWGSRLLFRGYGSSPRSWPRAAGLLAFDSAVVVDEAHLCPQLVTTARRVSDLARVAERGELGDTALQVVATTATHPDAAAAGSAAVGVEEADLEGEPELAARLTRPKPVTLRPAARGHRGLVDAVTDLIDTLGAGEGLPRTVGCFVNTVAAAVAVAGELRRVSRGGRALRVVMLCGQLRPYDLARTAAAHPGLLSTDGDPDVDVLVSTQTLEVGADLDLAGLVTELASGAAVVQRAGRVNRLGRRDTGPVTVVHPQHKITDRVRSGPYDAGELRAGLSWLRERAADPSGVAPWALRRDPAPAAARRRVLLQRPEWGDAELWARTSDDLHPDPELDLWLAEDLDGDDLSLGLVVRQDLPDDEAQARELLTLLPPRRHETFPLPYRAGRRALTRAHTEADAAGGELRALVVRGEETVALRWAPRRDGQGWSAVDLRPGDIVVVDTTAELFSDAADDSPRVVVPADDDTGRYPGDDVLEAPAGLLPAGVVPGPGEVVHRIDLCADTLPASRRRLLEHLDDLDPDPRHEGHQLRVLVGSWLARHAGTAMAAAAAVLLADHQARVDVAVQRDLDDLSARVVVIDRRRAHTDEDLRQEWSPAADAGAPPGLAAHQQAVAARAADLARLLGLNTELVDVLDVAGAHHDDGKADPRFQRRLRGTSSGAPTAKGDAASPLAARDRARRAALPAGWRHEQRSVLDAWAALDRTADPELVARLIGTTHGHGRAGFPHGAASLVPDPGELARELFDQGRWDELIERTHQRYGLWGCAYLEALLRGADGQVSREGR